MAMGAKGAMARNVDTASTVRLLAGRLCLDFVNTVDWRASAAPVELLGTYGDLLAWGRHAGLLPAREAAALRREAKGRPDAAAQVLMRARTLREAIHALVTGSAGREAALETLNAELARAPARSRVAPGQGGYGWAAAPDPPPTDRVLWPVAWSAASLLTDGEVPRVKQCEGPGCGWVFLDESRGHRRRWCAMEDCGNRAKARRHYARARAAGG